jgi:dipeptidyl aminopeptidase/acylaminoacyl peptidase
MFMNMPAPVWAQALDVRTALAARSLVPSAGLSVSADGEWIAFTVRRAEVQEAIGERPFFTSTGAWVSMLGTDIWVSNIRTGETRLLTGERANNWSPAWSPDGRRLAYYSDRSGELGLWVWDRMADQHRRISDRIVRASFSVASGPQWLPDGKSIVTKLLPLDVRLREANELANTLGRRAETASAKLDGATVTVFNHRPQNADTSHGNLMDRDWWTAAYGGDVAILDVNSGSVRNVAEGIRPLWWASSPDGRSIGYTHLLGTSRDDALVLRLATVDLKSGGERVLDDAVVQEWGNAVSWAPDGRHLAYFSDTEESPGLRIVSVGDGGRRTLAASSGISPGVPIWTGDGQAVLGASGTELWRVKLDGTTTRVRTSEGQRIQCTVRAPDGTLWTSQGAPVICAADPATLRRGLARCEVRRTTCDQLGPVNAVPGGALATVGLRDGRLITSLETEATPPELWLFGRDLSPLRRLSSLNPQFDRSLGTHRLVEWTGPDGRTARGALLLPPGFKGTERVPVVVSVYGGDRQSSQLSRFDPAHQVLATRGYAVFLPDMPLAGDAPAREIAQATTAAVDHLIKVGIADSTRLAVMGHSYGGYGVLAIITQTGRFRAAIASASQGNLISMYGQLREEGSAARVRWTERGQGRMGGTPWEVRERYIENSPFFRLDRVTTPLLLLHGSADPNTPAHEAAATFVALQRLNRRVAYARYEGEGHVVSWWSLTNQIDYWRRIIEWLDDNFRKENTSSSGH